MVVAGAGGESQSMQSARPIIAVNARRMAAPNRGSMIAPFPGGLQAKAELCPCDAA